MEIERNEALELIALGVLADADGPVGSMRLAEVFKETGHDLSQATAGRFLRQLDLLGLTKGDGGKRGRTITREGVARLEELKDKVTMREKSSRLMDAATVTDLSDLHELLLVRRAVEAEGARLAALRATDSELSDILAQARSHVRDVRAQRVPEAESSTRFHRSIAEASHNPMLISVALVLLEPSNPALTGVLENVSVQSAKVAGHANEHVDIAEALMSRDAELSQRLMYRHITSMIEPVQETLATGNGMIIEPLLSSEIGLKLS
ncbi:FCD domain-containing protein [Aminobacter sp. AP02]|uniref:FCD domain-containing protein n=1 Tax=Aminobacter sp. AP02 TaxID=2135737 RepID=UPI000D6C24DD|nr:FCD domain-containing protein [Aminobacter sp. AP02]PWK59996.1 DNA-binding FadR family transcriptional regulator [Aminobacter sp. AP02]